jgi:hypothetical protein
MYRFTAHPACAKALAALRPILPDAPVIRTCFISNLLCHEAKDGPLRFVWELTENVP